MNIKSEWKPRSPRIRCSSIRHSLPPGNWSACRRTCEEPCWIPGRTLQALSEISLVHNRTAGISYDGLYTAQFWNTWLLPKTDEESSSHVKHGIKRRVQSKTIKSMTPAGWVNECNYDIDNNCAFIAICDLFTVSSPRPILESCLFDARSSLRRRHDSRYSVTNRLVVSATNGSRGVLVS